MLLIIHQIAPHLCPVGVCGMMLSMVREARWGGRVVLVLLLLAAIACAQTHAFAFGHEHHSSEHYCLLCHVGSLPLLQSSVSAAVAPVLSPVWMALSDGVETPRVALLSAASSRAPPA